MAIQSCEGPFGGARKWLARGCALAVKMDRKPSDVRPLAQIDGGPIATLSRVDYCASVEEVLCRFTGGTGIRGGLLSVLPLRELFGRGGYRVQNIVKFSEGD